MELWLIRVSARMMLAFSLVFLSGTALASTVTVEAKGIASAAPDLAILSLSVSTLNDTVALAEAEASSAVSELLALIKGLPHDADSVSAAAVNIRPEYRWNRAQEKQVFMGYRVERQVTFELTAISALGRAIESLSQSAVTSMAPPVLKSSEGRNAEELAITKAVKAAKRRAEVIAAAAGQQIIGLESIKSVEYGNQAPPVALMRAESAMDSNAASYQPGELSYSANVVAVFTVEPL